LIAEAFQREVGDLIRFHAAVIAIHQTDRGVTVHYAAGGSSVSKVRIIWDARRRRSPRGARRLVRVH
jgi:monoamine oxidase